MSTFADYATGTAFAISLSRPQIECLCRIEQTGGAWSLLATSYALQRKGLIERTYTEQNGWQVRLTDAGHALMPLLKFAGLWIDCTMPEAVSIPSAAVHLKTAEARA